MPPYSLSCILENNTHGFKLRSYSAGAPEWTTFYTIETTCSTKRPGPVGVVRSSEPGRPRSGGHDVRRGRRRAVVPIVRRKSSPLALRRRRRHRPTFVVRPRARRHPGRRRHAPECIKLAPVLVALARCPTLATLVVNSGQHRDAVRQTLAGFGLGCDLELAALPARGNLRAACADLRQRLATAIGRVRPAFVLVQGDTLTAYAGARAGRDAGAASSTSRRGCAPRRRPTRFPRSGFGGGSRAMRSCISRRAGRRRRTCCGRASIRRRSTASATPASTACARCSTATASCCGRARSAPAACWSRCTGARTGTRGPRSSATRWSSSSPAGRRCGCCSRCTPIRASPAGCSGGWARTPLSTWSRRCPIPSSSARRPARR